MEAYCTRRWGSSGWTHSLKSEGRKDGAHFANWKWWPHTLRAHQLILFGRDRHQVDTSKSKAALFRALYEEGENISQTETLVKIGRERLGMDDPNLQKHLSNNEGSRQVLEEIEQGRRSYQIRGVPFFIIRGPAVDRPYGFSGAQSTDTFIELFEEVSGQEGDSS